MDKTFEPSKVEQSLYQHWEESGYFRTTGTNPDDAAKSGDQPPYCIMIPPPNVTGSLHMGHAFQDTIMDTLIRYHRMKGSPTLWQMGTDHAGIATQMVVERRLAAEGIDRKTLGREKFIEEIWKWKHESGSTITKQLRRMGASVDWERERFTMDDGLSNTVQTVFISLYEEGLIYRGSRLVNWDPKLQTAVSDLEVVSEEEQGHLWHLRYPLAEDSSQYLVVATTRPETMLGDTAVAVNPNDERYQHLIGKEISLPLTHRTIPIIADDYVDPEFGTGCVKITPAHDFNDYEVGQRHDLPKINIMTVHATINDNAPEEYRGLERFEARKKIIDDFEALDLLEKIEPHTLKVPRGDRSGVVIEPFLTDQWYVKVAPLAEPAIKAVENGDIEFVPKNWENTYFAWMREIQDWCISRQLWWGHRIPAWYDDNGNVYVGRSEEDVRQKHQLDASITLRQDDDVLDTWFSSALWTFSTLDWPNQSPELALFHPTSVLVTGFDIIFFWVARMIMMTLKFVGEAPFKKVYVHGLVRDAEGQKMSKTKGNVLDPIDLIDGIDLEELVNKRTQGLMQPQKAKKIEKATRKHFPEGIASYGTDALRFTFCSLASTGRDIRFDIGRIEGYRNFCNKIWNAARFIIQNCEQILGENKSSLIEHAQQAPQPRLLVNQWIDSRLQQTIEEVDNSIEKYRFDLASQSLYEFIWHEFCDWYLELSKPMLYGKTTSEADKTETLYCLVSTLEQLLRLAHPMMPYITEVIWQQLKPLLNLTSETIMLAKLPQLQATKINKNADADVDWLKQITIAVRNIRGEMNISPSQAISVLLQKGGETDRDRASKLQHFVCSLAKLDNITWLEADEAPPISATQVVGDLEVLVPLQGLVDPQAEMARLDKNLAKLKNEINRLEGKLNNDNFVRRAPDDVVAKEREKLNDAKSSLTILEAKWEHFAKMK